MNAHALRLTQRLGFAYCSDSRGTRPFVPVQSAEIVLCPQLPTTLPTLDELIGRDGTTVDNVHEHLLALTAHPASDSHVYTLHAELEGRKLSPVLERLLEGWRAQGYELVSLRGLFESLDAGKLPRHEMVRGEIAGRSGTLMLQGPEFLAP
jgi:peptidoglycan/xylan/chitin deacetylase (PgdA/CDA1 family)